LCGKEMLIEVDQVVATGQNVGVGLGGYFDAGTSPHRPELKTRAVVRKGVGPILVQEPRLDQKLGISWVTMVHVTDLGKIELVPTVRVIRLNGIPLVQIFDTVAEGVEGAGQFPAEDVMGFERIGVSYNSRIAPNRSRIARFGRSIEADQPVFASHLPIIVVTIAMV